jgi:hypothetical protein
MHAGCPSENDRGMCPPAEKVGSPISPTPHVHTGEKMRVRHARCRGPSHGPRHATTDGRIPCILLSANPSRMDIPLQRSGRSRVDGKQKKMYGGLNLGEAHFRAACCMAAADSHAPGRPTCVQSVHQRRAAECARQLRKSAPPSPSHTQTVYALNVRVRRAHCHRPSRRSKHASVNECGAHVPLCVGSSRMDIALQRAGHAQSPCQGICMEAKMARPISAQHVAWPRPAHAQRIGSQACALPTRPGPTDVPASCGRGLPISSHTHTFTGVVEGPPCTTPWTLARAKACRCQ